MSDLSQLGQSGHLLHEKCLQGETCLLNLIVTGLPLNFCIRVYLPIGGTAGVIVAQAVLRIQPRHIINRDIDAEICRYLDRSAWKPWREVSKAQEHITNNYLFRKIHVIPRSFEHAISVGRVERFARHVRKVIYHTYRLGNYSTSIHQNPDNSGELYQSYLEALDARESFRETANLQELFSELVRNLPMVDSTRIAKSRRDHLSALCPAFKEGECSVPLAAPGSALAGRPLLAIHSIGEMEELGPISDACFRYSRHLECSR